MAKNVSRPGAGLRRRAKAAIRAFLWQPARGSVRSTRTGVRRGSITHLSVTDALAAIMAAHARAWSDHPDPPGSCAADGRLCARVWRKSGGAVTLICFLPGLTSIAAAVNRAGGRFVCLGKPKPRETVVSEFDFDTAFKNYFGKSRTPTISGIGLGVDTSKAKNGGAAAAFIKSIEFIGADGVAAALANIGRGPSFGRPYPSGTV